MKPIFRNNPNIPLDVNDTNNVVVATADTTGEATVAGILTTSIIDAVYLADAQGSFTDAKANTTIPSDGTIVCTDATNEDVLIVFTNL